MRASLLLLVVPAALLVAAPAAAALGEQGKLEAAYRQALAAWAAGDEEGALASLQRFDQGSLASPREATRRERAKLGLARTLGRRDPSTVLAAAALEGRAYDAYVTRRQPLAVAARRMVAALVDLHVELVGSARGPRAAGGRPRGALEVTVDAAVLSSLAGELAARAQQTAAADLYGRALALVPRQSAALLGIAAMHEQRGEYARAAELLLTLVEAQPAAREARLRLGVNLIRLGKDRAGEAELRPLTREGADWIRSLAAQELARLLASRGDLAGASAVLAEATAVLPCDPSLPVQAALLGERAGAAVPLDLSTLDSCGEASESARARYTHAPSGELVALRSTVAAAEPQWRQALARALDGRSVARRGGS
jgi:tetratricopeptide (TPR) repeat protein